MEADECLLDQILGGVPIVRESLASLTSDRPSSASHESVSIDRRGPDGRNVLRSGDPSRVPGSAGGGDTVAAPGILGRSPGGSGGSGTVDVIVESTVHRQEATHDREREHMTP